MTGTFYLCYTYIVLIHYIFIVKLEPEMNARMETLKKLLPILFMILVLLAMVLYGGDSGPACISFWTCV